MEKENYLDGLRGIAAFIVVISHYLYVFYPALFTAKLENTNTTSGVETLIAKSPLNLLYNGNVSVCIFFILSGYVLTYKFFKNGDDESIVSGAVKRYIRLMPPVLFSIIIAFILMKLGFVYNNQIFNMTKSEWFGMFYNFQPNFYEMLREAFFKVFVQGISTYNPVQWTMYYEFCGSFIIFGVAYIFGRIKNRSVIYMCIVLLFINSKFLPFLFGMILCDFQHNNRNVRKIFFYKSINIILFIIGLLISSYPTVAEVDNTIYSFMKISYIEGAPYFYHSIGSALIMISLLNSNKLKIFFSQRLFVFMGKISFSMYLIHFPILVSLSSFIMIKYGNTLRYYQIVTIIIIISMLIITILSYFMYKYIDLQSIKLSKKIYIKYFK